MAYSRQYDGYKELLLNILCNRKQLNKPFKVGEVMALIRECQPETFEEWKSWYLNNAKTKTKVPIPVTEESLQELGVMLRDFMRNEFIPGIQDAIENLSDEEIESYVSNLAINRTYDGYIREKQVISELLSKRFRNVTFEESTPEQDHVGNIDFIINVNAFKIGLQIKPVTANANFGGYSLTERMQDSFNAFTEQYGGKVFIVFSKDNKIANTEVINEIQAEIERLRSL